MTTLRQINRALEKAGLPLIIERGEGYHYFIFERPEANLYATESVMTMYTSHQTVERWVEDGQTAWETIKADHARRGIEL